MAFITSILFKFCSLESLSLIVAKAISYILAWASKKGGSAWDTAKAVIVQINSWTNLFVQVYDDDNMSAEEEELVAKAIAEKTPLDKVVEIIKNASTKKDESSEEEKK